MNNHEQHEPTNPDVRFEHSDVNTNAAIGFAVALAVGLAVIMAAVWGLFVLFEDREIARKQSMYPSPDSVAGKSRIDRPPTMTPWIEGIPAGKPEYTFGHFGPASALTRQQIDDATLAKYEWLNAEHTAARIPIQEAMKRLAAQSGKEGGQRNP